jgi:hypothetical protein
MSVYDLSQYKLHKNGITLELLLARRAQREGVKACARCALRVFTSSANNLLALSCTPVNMDKTLTKPEWAL